MATTVGRSATLRLEKSASGPVLRAGVPGRLSADEFVEVAKSGYELIHNLTGCNCMSGRISFVVEDIWAETVRVQFEA